MRACRPQVFRLPCRCFPASSSSTWREILRLLGRGVGMVFLISACPLLLCWSLRSCLPTTEKPSTRVLNVAQLSFANISRLAASHRVSDFVKGVERTSSELTLVLSDQTLRRWASGHYVVSDYDTLHWSRHSIGTHVPRRSEPPNF